MTGPEPVLVLRAVRALVCAGVALSALELLCLRREFAFGGFYDWRPAQGGRGFVALLGPPSRLLALAALRLPLAAALAVLPLEGPPLAAGLLALLALSLATHVRLRFGVTGADPMMGIVLGALALAALVPADPLVARATVWFVALQGTIGYAGAGLTKLRVPAWWDGSYLRAAFRSRTFGSRWAERLLAGPGRARLAARVVIVVECAFPLALVGGVPVALAFCVAAAGFHVAVAGLMGLKMFVLVFASTYPAIVACAAWAS